MDQRICIKFCVKNEIKCNKVCEMITKAYGESAMSKTRVYEWYKRFQDGREDVEDDERLGRPSTSTTDKSVEKVKEMVMNDRRITIREVADDVGKSIGSCHEIFSNVLGMKRVAAKFVPKLLNFEQKQRRMEVVQEQLNEVNDDAELLKRITTIETLQMESTSHRPLCKWQCQSGNLVRAKVRDDGRFFLSLSTRTTLERDSLTLRITLARADRFQAGLSTLFVISLWLQQVTKHGITDMT